MTLPDERTRAVLLMAERALAVYRTVSPAICPSGATGTVTVSAQALTDLVNTLRHYPTTYDLARSAEAAPDIWAPPEDGKGGGRVPRGTDDPGP